MIKKIALSGFVAACICSADAQPVFTYGKYAVYKQDFLKAFNKNPSEDADRQKALKEYLDLFINFKLKVQAAYDAGLQNDPTQKYELENFKKQIADNVINDEAKVQDLTLEAFTRSQKDVRLAQVFIEVPAKTDTAEAFRKISAAYEALKAGKDFSQVSQEYSNDAFTKQTGGDLGYITVFTLPYTFENVAYSLRANEYSAPFRSKLGYHIFKNVAERKALGRRRVAQILITLPPGTSAVDKEAYKRKADSVYFLLQQGFSFDELVKTTSNDVSSVNNNGQLNEFGVGQYSQVFEQEAFALTSPGQLSKPFETGYGYHIIKLVEAKPAGGNFADAETSMAIKDKVLQDDRITQSRKKLIEKRLVLIGYKPGAYNEKLLWAFTDSALQNNKTTAFKDVHDKTVIFGFTKQKITAGDWLKFVRAVRTMQNETGKKEYPELMKEYVGITAGEYYRNHLEDYSPLFKQQVQEFREANLLFGIMDKQVWSKSNTDTLGLKKHYAVNKEKYKWSPSADALIVTCNNPAAAQVLQNRLKDSIADWRTVIERFGNMVTADSGRYELAQLPVVDRTNFQAGIVTAPVKNLSDSSVSFNYIFKVYPQNDQRSFEEARGMIISDYQQVLEARWLQELKNKYPVKVNQAVFRSILEL